MICIDSYKCWIYCSLWCCLLCRICCQKKSEYKCYINTISWNWRKMCWNSYYLEIYHSCSKHKKMTHSVRAHNSKQLYVSSVSSNNDFLLVGIFKGVVSDKEEEDSIQDSPIHTWNLNVNLGDWILVNYDRQKFPGEVTHITGLDFEVNVMHKSLGAFWNWLQKEDKMFYQKDNMI